MAIVFLAEDRKHHRQVAVKTLRAELAGVLGPERFPLEIETAARLHHPHILPLYDSGEADGFLYYVMPLVEGESLRDRLRREKQLPVDDALQIAREVADALSYAHTHGVVHRDIKPENILLESGHAVVADFGIARAVSAAGGDRLTQTGLSLGTPMYMSPEQAAGGQDLDGRSDLYSLGCVLYKMLAGEPPFTGPTAASVIRQHIAVEPRSIAQLRPAVPAGIAEAISRALAKTPADRFNPVGQFADALGKGRETDSTPARAAPAAPPQGFVGRAAWRWASLGAAALIVAALVWALARGKPEPPSALSETPRIVVLPFANLGRPEDEYFADGMTEEVTSRIGATPGLGVIARTSADVPGQREVGPADRRGARRRLRARGERAVAAGLRRTGPSAGDAPAHPGGRRDPSVGRPLRRGAHRTLDWGESRRRSGRAGARWSYSRSLVTPSTAHSGYGISPTST
jgi:serine/threonine-protein kinase